MTTIRPQSWLAFIVFFFAIEHVCEEQTFAQDKVRAETGLELLTKDLAPYISLCKGQLNSFELSIAAELELEGIPQAITLQLTRYDEEEFDLQAAYKEYSIQIRRRTNGIAMALPQHKVVFLGDGSIEGNDTLRPSGIANRLITPYTDLSGYYSAIAINEPSDIIGTLIASTKISWDERANQWVVGNKGSIRFDEDSSSAKVKFHDQSVTIGLVYPLNTDKRPAAIAKKSCRDWPEYETTELPRSEIESQLARGVRRAFEIFMPGKLLTSPKQTSKTVQNGELKWVDGQRVVKLWGTAEEIGRAHASLLPKETMRCIDSVMNSFGTVQTIVKGKWFRHELQDAYKRLAPNIPERHLVETRALASAMSIDPELMSEVNVFPELFHCSGFAVFGKATVDGKLYHGRVLDYMTTIGLQDAATTFIVQPDGFIPFVNIGYAGFIGSVSGMNNEQVSLGEMGGKGEGKWDGVPMATLMRRALEECKDLDAVKKLWTNSPRTCEYYYVFADGKTRSAVGVAATPEKIEFVEPGQSHELLGEGIPDSLALSAGQRLTTLKQRIRDSYGKIDTDIARELMCRPVAMKSNLHNVLFVPEDKVVYIANASHKLPAAERPYMRLSLDNWFNNQTETKAIDKKVSTTRTCNGDFVATDTIPELHDPNVKAQDNLRKLTYPAGTFHVEVELCSNYVCDHYVRFSSPTTTGDATNDMVTMELYCAKDKEGNLLSDTTTELIPSVVVIHESGKQMVVGRLIARSLSQCGVHAFMLQLPYYGARRGESQTPSGEKIVQAVHQAIGDVRRAKDAVAAIPTVDPNRISLQGTSLGGFVSATAASLDASYHRVFILLAGGDLFNVLTNGRKDAANLRKEIQKTGVSDEDLKSILSTIEPLTLAHRLKPEQTWLYSAMYDDVVPSRNADLLAKKIGLPERHHVRMVANHYSGIMYLPFVICQIAEEAKSK